MFAIISRPGSAARLPGFSAPPDHSKSGGHTVRQALALAALLTLATAASARAHAFLDHTAPLVGGTVKQPPADVRLWYTQGLEPTFSRLQVFDASGKEVDKHDAHLDAKNNHLLVVSLPALGAGTYKVVWRVVSVDTHPTEGSFTFKVGP